MAFSGEELLAYACGKFEEQKYDEALEAFVLAYTKGIEPEWVLENIYSCYMEANEPEFRQTYDGLKEQSGVAYESCSLDFIPYKEGEYYVFDKQQCCFLGIFSVRELEQTPLNEELQQMEFSAVAVEVGSNWKGGYSVLTDAKKRKIYAVSKDVASLASYYKIPELAEYMRNVKLFSDWKSFQMYFHEHTDVYLPKMFFGNTEAGEIFQQIFNEEHEYRLTPAGRNTSNVLLTIGIPTANRGNLVLKRLENLLSMSYDAEIEIAISKNCITLYEEEYKKVGEITDARVQYFDHGRELKYYMNWNHTVMMSHGKYVLLVADEDDVILEALEHYMRLLQDYPQVNCIRSRTTFQYRKNDHRVYAKSGVQAFEAGFLRQNYLSGLIVKRQDFVDADVLSLEKFFENVFYNTYPHEWWRALLSRMGDYMEEPIFLIQENESVLDEELNKLYQCGMVAEENLMKGPKKLPAYSTYEARLVQFLGQVEFLHFFCAADTELMEKCLEKVICKACYLFQLARSYDYDVEHFGKWMNQYASNCIEVIEQSDLNVDQKKSLLECTKNCCMILRDYHEERLAVQGREK